MVDSYREAAAAIRQASALIITAGAGMGVDSGLPDFRGDKGFWNAYPMYERLGMNFIQAANPENFEDDPAFGWGFYGHRTNLYRHTTPHPGFGILQRWIKQFKLSYFIATSNVDGQFQKAGYSEANILEVHGSIHHYSVQRPAVATSGLTTKPSPSMKPPCAQHTFPAAIIVSSQHVRISSCLVIMAGCINARDSRRIVLMTS